MKRVLFGVLVISLGLLLNACNTTEPPPPPPNGTTVYNTINLSIEWTDLHRIKIKWNISVKDTLNTYRYELSRKNETGGETTKNFFISGTDTSYVDGETDSLASGRNFIYKVRAYGSNDKLIDTSKTIVAKTLSPTSHNISWQIDTLGQPGDFLYDVWGLDENNVWAVGAITINGIGTNIIKWNGSEWQPFPRASFPGWGNAIFGFSESDIWVVGGGTIATAAHWNSSSWTEYSFYPPGQDTVWALRAIWGSASDDVWAVGDKGTIINWDGSEWRKISASITTPITDVCGVSQSEVYLIAYDNISSGTSAVFKFNGFAWEKISTIGIFNYGGETIWKTPAGILFAGGKTLLEFTGNSYEEIFTEGRSRYIIKISGSNTNNIFTVGTFGEITHFNGVSWINLDDFEVPDGRYRVLYSVWCTENKVFIVGVDENRAIIITGIIN